MKMKTGTIKQKVTLNASPQKIYELLMDSKKHSAFTGAKAKIGKKEGDAYSAYDGYIDGRNISLEPGKLIVQTWRSNDGVWPEDHYSIVVFDLRPAGKKTELFFTHADVPIGQVKEFTKGWPEHYWDRITEFLK